ncbi:MAG TPA: GNAT family N-acetyltransferase [Streptosporangiaceae bacterium]
MAEIRRAVGADVPAIAACVRAAYEMYVPRMGMRPAPMDADHAARVAAGQTYVLTSEDAVAGLIVLVPEDGDLLVENVAVHPSHQGHGYGRVLMEFAERRARETGAGSLTLYTHEFMTENQRIYTRLGYTETTRRTEHGFARVFMAKPLSR